MNISIQMQNEKKMLQSTITKNDKNIKQLNQKTNDDEKNWSIK